MTVAFAEKQRFLYQEFGRGERTYESPVLRLSDFMCECTVATNSRHQDGEVREEDEVTMRNMELFPLSSEDRRRVKRS
jgi:hypothetical protein